MNKRYLRHCSYFMLCLVLGYSYFHTKKEKTIQKEVSVVDYQDYMEVVYIDEDDVLIPIHYPIKDCPSVQSYAYELFNLMKKPVNVPEQLQSIIPLEMELESVILEDDILQLHLKNIQAEKELRLLEAFAYVFCQLDGVKGIELYHNENEINQLPEGVIVFNEPMTKELGINNFELGAKRLYQTKPVTVYYAKEIGDEELYVPISKRIDANSSFVKELQTIVSEISVSSTLNQPSIFKGVKVLEDSYMEDGHLYVNMNSVVLFDETTINQDIYDLLLLSFSQLDEVQQVSILVDGECIETRETIAVSDITYNIAKL